MSSLTEQSERETTNRKSGSSNGCTASPNLSQNAHGNRGTVTKEKAAWQAGLQSWGLRMGGGAPSLWDPFIFLMYVQNQILPTMYLQMKKQLSIIVAHICKICFCYSFEKFQVYNDRFQAQGAGMQEPGDGSNYMHLYLRISNHAPSNLECLLENEGEAEI